MSPSSTARHLFRWSAAGAAGAVAGYVMYAGWAWLRYGRPAPPAGEDADALLDRFMPVYEVAERHHVQVNAPAAITLAAAADVDFAQSPVIRAIFRARELVLGAGPDSARRPSGLLAQMTSLGWGVLAQTDREIVVGAVTQPWLANVVFRRLPPAEFPAFSEPGYVKIVWTLRADPVGPTTSIFRTETRVITTDAGARRRFRGYWARFSAGIILIRHASLGVLKREAERRAAGAA